MPRGGPRAQPPNYSTDEPKRSSERQSRVARGQDKSPPPIIGLSAAVDLPESLAVVFVVAAEPESGLVTPSWRSIEPLVHAPERRPTRARRPSRCGRRRRPRARTRSCPAARACMWPRRFRSPRLRHDLGVGRLPSPSSRRACLTAARAGSCTRCRPHAVAPRREVSVEVGVEVAAERGRPGKLQPIRRLYACSFASGARDTAASVTSWLARWTTEPLKPSAIAEQAGQPAV